MKITRVPFIPSLGQAIFEGRKTKTRRVIPFKIFGEVASTTGAEFSGHHYDTRYFDNPEHVGIGTSGFVPPYGPPGSRIVVSENYYLPVELDEFPSGQLVAEGSISKGDVWWAGRGKPDARYGRVRTGRFLPTVLARSVCEITAVKSRRLQDMTEANAVAEGVELFKSDGKITPVFAFSLLWDSINAERGFPWSRNPFVWQYTFRRINH